MGRSVAILLTLAVTSIFASGCCCVDRVYRPSGCNDGFDPVLGTCSGCGSCGGDCGGHTPSQVTRHKLACGSGCGELYWGEWISDPPDPCDPCDGCGNYVGPRCCPPSIWRQLFCCETGFWGGRINECGGCDSGCSSCAGGSEQFFDQDLMEGEVHHAKPGVPQHATPRSKNGPTRAKPQQPSPPQPMPEADAPATEAPTTDAPAMDNPMPETPAPNTQTFRPQMQRRPSQKPMLLQPARAERPYQAAVRKSTTTRPRSL